MMSRCIGRWTFCCLGVIAPLLTQSVANAVPLVDGTLVGDEAEYGDPLFIQTITTQFGNSTDPSAMTSNGGSEIDGLYATVKSGRLYMLVTGNLESNFNKLEIFLDTQPGGFQELPFDDFSGGSTFGNEYPEVEPFINGDVNGTGAFQRMQGILFDDDFEPEYFAAFTNGSEDDIDGRWAFNVQFSEIAKLQSAGGPLPEYPTPVWGTAGGSFEAQVDGGVLIDANTADVDADPDEVFFIDRTTDNSVMQINATIDNSNIAGVAGGSGEAADMDAAAAVVTGVEWSIPLSQIGNPTESIVIGGFINGGGHDFVSNQVIGGLPEGFGNLANPADGLIDFTGYDGDQFVILVIDDEPLIGDFNANGVLDQPDIDDLTFQSAGDTNPPTYDLNADTLVNEEDVTIWIKELFGSWIGDANVDLEFNTADLILVFASGKFDTGEPAVWSTGDFDGNGLFDSADIVGALGDGGFGAGQRPPAATAAVPEPVSGVSMIVGVLLLALGYRRR